MHGPGLAVVLILAAMPPADPARTPAPPGQASPLRQTIAGIWRDAKIAEDDEYQRLIPHIEAKVSAPLDMRRLVLDWPDPRQLRGWVQKLGVSFEHERITFSWKGEIG